ncbi:hypothetical protein CR513_42262, partial [Mucuna pruriens]
MILRDDGDVDNESSHEETSTSGSEGYYSDEVMLVEKLEFPNIPHPRPYKLQWLSEKGEIIVNKQVNVELTLGKYKDEILYGVVPMEATHILLGRL